MFTTTEITIDEALGAKLTVMTQYISDVDTAARRRPAVLILPGGGYSVCSDGEGETIAVPYIAAGYQAFVLRYAVGADHPWPAPLQEYEQVMEMIRDNEERWHVDSRKVAVIGFSAGGHLAGCAATMAQHRPAAAILVYAALNAASAALCRDNLPDPSKEVDDLTPPCFLCTAADDTLLGTEPTLAFAESLSKFKIRYEMHIYPQGGHGFANGHTAYHANPSCRNLRNWQQESIAFLEGMFGQVTTQGVGEATLSSHVTADRDDYLSVGCTVAHLRLQHMAAPIFDPVYAAIEKTVSQMFGPISAQIMDFVQTTPLDAILHLAKTPDDQAQALDTALLQIPNEKEAVSL